MNERALVAHQFDNAAQQRDAATLGMWIFLATEILFFGALFVAYAVSRIRYPEAFAAASRLTDVTLGSINTAVLLTSSLTMALGVRATGLRARRAALGWLCATALLGIAFVAIKGVEYRHEFTGHLVPGFDFGYAGPHPAQVAMFFCFYFAMTGVHALHLVIGIGVVGVMLVRMWHDTAGIGDRGDLDYESIEMTGLYWHLVDVIWIFLYPLIYLVSRA